LNDILIEYRAILATLCVSLIGAFVAVYIHRRNGFRLSSTEFISAFVNELAILNSPLKQKPGTVYEALLSAFDKHQRATLAFEHFLPFYSKSGFNKAWDTYRKHSANFGKEWPDHEKMNHLCEYLATNDEEERNAKDLALQRLNKLLSYANVR